MCSRSRCLLLCVGLSLAGVATAAATLISIVTNYCATDNACEHRTETLSYMVVEEGFTFLNDGTWINAGTVHN